MEQMVIKKRNGKFRDWCRNNRALILEIMIFVLENGMKLVDLLVKKNQYDQNPEKKRVIGYNIANVKETDDDIGSKIADCNCDKCEIINQEINEGVPFTVKSHLRFLPDGWHASDEKKQQAEELGILLQDNQTIVSAYMKNA